MSQLPLAFRVRQRFARPSIEDVAAETAATLDRLQLQRSVRPGQTVAITAGSRGVANIAVVLREIVAHVRSLGGQPFLVPAMGSHGGGTAEGQVAILRDYGVTESFCGCPIQASMDTVVACQAAEGFPVHFDRQAFAADHVIVCNRVKPHTNFSGDIESGLMKMMLIGLGKHAGALVYHRAIQDYSFGQIVRSVAREVLTRCRVLAGVALVENGYDETAWIEAVAPEDFESREIELLKLAKQWMPKLPFEAADLLLIDQIGKNISGTGMDTNIVGRKFAAHAAGQHEFPKIRLIAVRSLTPQTHGNATGLGLAEFCKSLVAEQRDERITRINCITGGHAIGAMLPVVFSTDREILEAAVALSGLKPAVEVQMMWIQDTLHVAEVECSQAYWPAAQHRDELEILSELRPWPLDQRGQLPATMAAGH